MSTAKELRDLFTQLRDDLNDRMNKFNADLAEYIMDESPGVSGEIWKVVASSRINLRDHPSLRGSIIGHVEPSTLVTQLEEQVDGDHYTWMKVNTNTEDGEGYMAVSSRGGVPWVKKLLET